MANYNSSYTGSQIDNAVGKVVANAGTAGQVLTADGSGGSSWQDAGGGGGIYMHNIQFNDFSVTPSRVVNFCIYTSSQTPFTSVEDIYNAFHTSNSQINLNHFGIYAESSPNVIKRLCTITIFRTYIAVFPKNNYDDPASSSTYQTYNDSKFSHDIVYAL